MEPLADVGIQPSVIGGATIGYDFVNSGFGAYAWPDWMKYFSFAMDITYNRLNIHGGQTVDATFQDVNLGNVCSANNMYLKGYEVAWTFLFMAHYGFMPDSEVPSGRINPYIGVGPAILWSGFENPIGDGQGRCHERRPGGRTRHPVDGLTERLHRYRHAVPLCRTFL